MPDPSTPGAVPDGPGRRVAQYEIVAEIGRGGMGLVYRAHDSRLGRDVALKRPWPELAAEPEYQRRFLLEARAASRLAHPNIVPVYEVFEEQGTPWMALQFVEGESLDAAIRRRGPLPVEEALRYGEELCGALQAAHDRGILHRDIKPTNVIVTPDGHPMLTDFGLARMLPDGALSHAQTASGSLTGEGRILGTPGYMAPEQALGERIDSRADLFSLGALLYEMSTAQPAFKGANHAQSFEAVLNREPVAMVRFSRNIPDELERIVQKALSKRPNERYQAANEMLADLRALRRRLESVDLPGRSPASTPTATPAAGVAPAQRLRRGLLASAVIVATAILLVALGTRLDDSPLPATVPRQLTTQVGWENQPAISPDGSLVAYVSAESGNPDIWLLDAGGGKPLQLTDDPGVDRAPAWFPDASAIAFVSERGGAPAIYKVNRLGGAATPYLERADEPAFSSDGTRIAFLRPDQSGDLKAMVAPLAEPGAARLLGLTGQGLWDHGKPAFSPDGQSVCFSGFRNLWLAPTEGGPARQLTRDDVRSDHPTFSPDGRFIYYASSREGTHALWRIRARGGEPARLTLGTGPESEPSLSRDGRRMAYSTWTLNTDLVFLDRQSGSEVQLPGLSEESWPRIRPDGRAMVFVSNREGGKHDLWLVGIEGRRPSGAARKLTDRAGNVAAPSWSPDGRYLAFYSVVRDQRDLFVVAADGGDARPCAPHQSSDLHPVFSPDGQRIAFISARDGTSRVWTVGFADGRCTGEPRPLTRGSATEMFPRFTPDGRDLLVWRVGHGIVRVPLDSPESESMIGASMDLRRALVDRQDGTLLVSGLFDGRMALRRLDGSSGREMPPHPDVRFGADATLGEFDLSADGGLLVYTREELRGDIWLLEASQGRF